MPMKLYAHPHNYKTHKALIAARYVGLEIDTPAGAQDAPRTGKIPVLETDQGCIFSSNAIARYIARINRQVGLYGQSLIEGGFIDSWIEFCTHELEVPLLTWVCPIMGQLEEVPEATTCAKEDVKLALSVLDKHLLHNIYMVGHSITLADISVCCALVDGMSLVLDAELRRPYTNLMRWFNLMLMQPEFRSVLGEVKLVEKTAAGGKAAGGNKGKEKTEAKKKEKKDAAAKNDADPRKEAAPKEEAQPKKKGKEEKGKAENKDQVSGGHPDGFDDSAPSAPPSVAEGRGEDADKKLKKVIKEGGKRGVEIEGAADMGGLQFFSTAVEAPNGDLQLLGESMKAMNAESDPAEEERKGGSGHIGKMIFSAGTEQLAVVAYVPKEKQSELSCAEWLKAVLDSQGGCVAASAEDVCSGFVKADPDKGLFPLKIREPMILEANNFLRKRGLFPEDDDDDEMVFGDDDFPS